MADQFDRFTERARLVLQLASEEAKRMEHRFVGTGHLLLGMVRERDGIPVRVLTVLGADEPKIRRAVSSVIAAQGDPTDVVGLSEGAKKVIMLSIDEARRLQHPHVDSHHLLLALLRHGKGTAIDAIDALEISLADVHSLAVYIMNQPSEPDPQRGQVATRPGSRFDRFTDRARTVMRLAQEEAHSLNHNYIGTEHLLLGLLREGEGVAAKVLINLGVKLDEVRRGVEFIIGRGDRTITGDIGLTPRAKKVIELSVSEARRLNHHYIGTEHLLLGLVAEGEGIAVGVLESLGVSLVEVISQVIYVLNASVGNLPGEMGSAPPRTGPAVRTPLWRNRAVRQAGFNKAIVRRYYEEVRNEGNLKLMDELFAPSFVSRPSGGTLAAFVQTITAMDESFPDLRITIDEQVAEGNTVVTRWTARGTHRGAFMGVSPTGREVTVSGVQIHRLARGKIVELWEQLDLFGLMQQLGGPPPKLPAS